MPLALELRQTDPAAIIRAVPGKCSEPTCEGSAALDSKCLGHLEDDEIGLVVSRHRQQGTDVDMAEATVSAEKVTTILRELGGGSSVIKTSVSFRGARVTGDLVLSGLTLQARIDFAGAQLDDLMIGQVQGLAQLRLGAPAAPRTRLRSLVVTDQQDVGEELTVAEVDVAERVHIRRTALRYLGFERVRLGEWCVFSDVEVGSTIELLGCSCKRLSAEHLSVAGGVTMTNLYAEEIDLRYCIFGSWADVFGTAMIDAHRCTFGGPARIEWSKPADVAPDLGTVGPRRDVDTTGVEPPPEQAAAARLGSVRFESTAHIRWGGGPVALPGCVFSDASTLAQADGATTLPRLTDVAELDGDELRIRAVDVSACWLGAAASLGPIESSGLELGFGSAGLTHRHYLADEQGQPSRRDRAQIVSGERRARWRSAAQQIASTYRDLRCSNEEIGNHASANDLYYGERLWERKGSRAGRIDWLWLTVYGMVGYGVRPLRPFLWLIGLILAGTVLFGLVDGLYRERVVAGAPTEKVAVLCASETEVTTPRATQRVACPADFSDRLEFSFRTTTTLIRQAGGFETRGAGTVVDIGLRLGSALFFALLILAMRNRVRR